MPVSSQRLFQSCVGGLPGRLCEEEGIHYHFRHSADGHMLVFGDDQTGFPRLAPTGFDQGNGMVADDPVIKRFAVRLEARTSRVSRRDYDHNKARLLLAEDLGLGVVQGWPKGHIPAGEEQIFIHAQRDWDQNVQRDQKIRVGNERHERIEANRYTENLAEEHHTTHGDRKTEIKADDHLTVGTSQHIKLG